MRGNGTGPEGKGPMTGWGSGNCTGQERSDFRGPDMELNFGRGPGRGLARGPGRGYGRGFRGGARQGQGRAPGFGRRRGLR